MRKNILLILVCLLFINFNKVYSNQVFNLEVLNTTADEFAPSYNRLDNTLFFNRSTEHNIQLLKARLNINHSEQISQQHLTKIVEQISPASDAISQGKLNPRYIAFNQKEALFVGKKLSSKGAIAGIYSARYEKNNWQLERFLDELDPNNFAMYPTISPNGNILVFCYASTTKPDDIDLYVAYRNQKNQWEGITSLTELNTNLAEITPYFASDDTLYFASNGFDGLGGFDIFYSIYENGKWQKPRPVEGVNTQYDESDFVKINDNLYFFSSNRPGGLGGFDIWAYYRSFEEDNDEQTSVAIFTNTNKIKAKITSQIVKLKKNNSIDLQNIKTNYNEDKDFIYLISDTLATEPALLQINVRIANINKKNQIYLNLFSKDNTFYETKISASDTTLLVSLSDYIRPNDLPDKIYIKAKIVNLDNDNYDNSNSNEVEIYRSNVERNEIFYIDNQKYRLVIVPLPNVLDNQALSSSLSFLAKEVNYKNGKIIIESSPTFELYDNEKIRNFLNTLNINNNAIMYQKKVTKNLSKYFNSLNFNYLLIFIQS